MDVKDFLAIGGLLFFGSVGGTVIGDRCNYDDDCFVEHSYCLRQEICECKENFIASYDFHYCTATIGAICNTRHDCSTLSNSDCMEGNCICTRGFVPDPHNAACKEVSSGLKGNCEFDAQCQEIMGDFAFCSKGHCECLPNFHFLGKCVKSRALGDTCRNSSECYTGDKYNNTECIGSQCKCKHGFFQTPEGYCRSRAITNSLEQLLLFFSIFIILKCI